MCKVYLSIQASIYSGWTGNLNNGLIILTEEGPVQLTKPKNDSQQFQCLCSEKPKSVKFHVLVKQNLSFR